MFEKRVIDNKNDDTKDLTKVDFDLTQLNQTSMTPHPVKCDLPSP